MPRRKAPPRRNEGVGADAGSGPLNTFDEPRVSKKSRSIARNPLASFVVPVIRSAVHPGDRHIARLVSERLEGSYNADDVFTATQTTHVQLCADSRNKGFEWCCLVPCDEDAKREIGSRHHVALPSSSSDKPQDDDHGETLLGAFFDLVQQGVLGLIPTIPNGSDGIGHADLMSESISRAELNVVLADAAFANQARHPEEVSRLKKHAQMRCVLKWLCPPQNALARLAAGLTDDGSIGGNELSTDQSTNEEKYQNRNRQSATRFVFSAAKPPGDAPAFLGDFSGALVPTPTPYQRRAVRWMVRREKGGADAQTKSGVSAPSTSQNDGHPLWHALLRESSQSYDTSEPAGFINWHTGQTRVDKFPPPNDVLGGILADEMGLGKTVELLMTILAHRYRGPAPTTSGGGRDLGKEQTAVKRERTERTESKPEPSSETPEIVGCVCGKESAEYDGLWLACDSCGEWSHARCVGYNDADEKKHVKKGAVAREKLQKAREETQKATSQYDLAFCSKNNNDPPTIAAYYACQERFRAAEKNVAARALEAAEAEELCAKFVCGRCVARRAGAAVSGPCGATLVVCPGTILNQWVSELKRHTKPGALKVVVYEGQPRDASGPKGFNNKMTEKTNAPTSALDLASADVVLTTYDTLRNDLHHSPDAGLSVAGGVGDTTQNGGRIPSQSPKARSSRHKKKYEVIPTPLTRLFWWRVVLDEAQEVESSTAACAQMAALLPGKHRWCVTGTPVSKGVDDLFGLFAFLNAPSPLTEKTWFKKFCEAPFEKNHLQSREYFFDVLQKMMWRNSREDVADELKLPPQGQTVTTLRPSGIEAHWYRKQKLVCELAATKALARVVARDFRDTVVTGKQSGTKSEQSQGRLAGHCELLHGDTGDFVVDDGDETDASRDDRTPARAHGNAHGNDTRLRGQANSLQEAEIPVDRPTHTDHPSRDRRLTPAESRVVLLPLLRLRQACNHPQAGTHGIRGVTGGKGSRGVTSAGGSITEGGIHTGSIMSMPQIHAVLIEKQKIEAEEAQRLVAFTLNASAGVAFCLKDFGVAVEHYRAVLRLEREGMGEGLTLRLDPLQRLHALHNLNLALDAARSNADETSLDGMDVDNTTHGTTPATTPPPTPAPSTGVSHTLRDDSLVTDANTERHKYLAARAGGVPLATTKFLEATAAVTESLRKCGAASLDGPAGCAWWIEVLQTAGSSPDGGKGFLDRLVETCLGGSWQGNNVAFTDVAGLRFTMERELQNLTEKRKHFVSDMQTLRKITQDANPHDVDNAGRCGTCVTGGGERNNFFGNGANSHATRKSNVTCAHCAVSADMTAYEDSIFGRQASDDHVRGGARGRVARADVGAGRSAPSSVEYALRYLLTKFGPGVGKPQSTAVAEATVQSLENMRREFQRGNVLQKHQRDALHAADELCMATTRIRTRGSHEIALGGLPDPIPEHLRASVVHDWELPEMETQYASDRIVYKSELRKATSQVRFLQRLKREDDASMDEDSNDSKNSQKKPFECPICIESVDKSTETSELAILPCGHKLCVSCVDALVSRAPPSANPKESKKLKCPSCREKTSADEINYVSHGGSRVTMERHVGDVFDDSKPCQPIPDSDANIGPYADQLLYEQTVSIKGSWGTKIEAVTRRVLWLLDAERIGADPALKILIFSEWEDALKVVAAALSANSVTVSHPGGGGVKLRDAISEFSAGNSLDTSLGNILGNTSSGAMNNAVHVTPPECEMQSSDAHEDDGAGSQILPDSDDARTQGNALMGGRGSSDHMTRVPQRSTTTTRVLLLPLKRGANGLNLTCASHVLLLEPVLDLGLEQQCVKRVDRIGQTKQTWVHRFLLRDTVEENVFALSRRRRAGTGSEAQGDTDKNARGAGLTIGEAKLLIQGE